MHITRNKCKISGCNGQPRGKGYCGKHLKEKREPVAISNEVRLSMRSDCCKAKCVGGESHENGKQYCVQCKNPCCWQAH